MGLSKIDAKIISVNVGMPEQVDYRGKLITTAIYKKPVHTPLTLNTLNFSGDRQADLEHHGGRDKAVCVYPYEHYSYWKQRLLLAFEVGAFGENLTVTGLKEEDVCIGDVYQVVSAVVQISQPRQPCYKLAAKFDVPELPVYVRNTGFSGYYLRVIQEGTVERNDPIIMLERQPHEITVLYANQIMYHESDNMDAIKQILKVESLSDSWRNSFLQRLSKQSEQ